MKSGVAPVSLAGAPLGRRMLIGLLRQLPLRSVALGRSSLIALREYWLRGHPA